MGVPQANTIVTGKRSSWNQWRIVKIEDHGLKPMKYFIQSIKLQKRRLSLACTNLCIFDADRYSQQSNQSIMERLVMKTQCVRTFKNIDNTIHSFVTSVRIHHSRRHINHTITFSYTL